MSFEDALQSMTRWIVDGLEAWEKNATLTTRSILIDGAPVQLRGIVCDDGWVVGIDPDGIGWALPPSYLAAQA